MTDQSDEEQRLHCRPTAVLYCAAAPTVGDDCSITQARFCCVAAELTEEEEPECSAALWAVSWLKLPSDWPIVSATVGSTNWTPVQRGTATTHTHTQVFTLQLHADTSPPPSSPPSPPPHHTICDQNKQTETTPAQHPHPTSAYLVGPLVGLQQLGVEWGFVLDRVQTKEAAVVEGVGL